MNQLISDNLEKIKDLCEHHKVDSLFAFGSVCSDHFHEGSDVDLLVAFLPMEFRDYADNYFEVAEKLEKIFNRQVDLVTEKSLSNPYFIASINKSKILLYG